MFDSDDDDGWAGEEGQQEGCDSASRAERHFCHLQPASLQQSATHCATAAGAIGAASQPFFALADIPA